MRKKIILHSAIIDNQAYAGRSLPVHHDDTGYYAVAEIDANSRPVLSATVLVIGGNTDYAVYTGYCSPKMSAEQVIEAIAGYGDKLLKSQADQLLSPAVKTIVESLHYRS